MCHRGSKHAASHVTISTSQQLWWFRWFIYSMYAGIRGIPQMQPLHYRKMFGFPHLAINRLKRHPASSKQAFGFHLWQTGFILPFFSFRTFPMTNRRWSLTWMLLMVWWWRATCSRGPAMRLRPGTGNYKNPHKHLCYVSLISLSKRSDKTFLLSLYNMSHNKEKFGYQGNTGSLKTEWSFKGNILSHKNDKLIESSSSK